MTISFSRGRSRSTFFRLCSRAPRMEMNLCSGMPCLVSVDPTHTTRCAGPAYMGAVPRVSKSLDVSCLQRGAGRLFQLFRRKGKRKEQRPNNILTDRAVPKRPGKRADFAEMPRQGLTAGPG